MNNTAGRVVFDHGTHVKKLGIDCRACHHDALTDDQAGQNCKTCHGLEFDASFRGHSVTMDPSTCATCHHMTLSHKKWGHSRHTKELNIDCQACHHGPQIEATPQNCANCHDRKTDMGPILSLKKRRAHPLCQLPRRSPCRRQHDIMLKLPHGHGLPRRSEAGQAPQERTCSLFDLPRHGTFKACSRRHGCLSRPVHILP